MHCTHVPHERRMRPHKPHAPAVGRDATRADRMTRHRARATGPTVDLAVTFQTHGYHERVTFSTTEESGMGNSWSKLAVPYTCCPGTCSR